MAAYRFVHTADIHLDSPLRSLALRNRELAELIGNATRQAFARTIDLCLEEQVDALLLAGDLYDGEQTSMKTARFLAERLHHLGQAGVETFIVRGNHDALSKITRELTFPDTVNVFKGRADALEAKRRSSGSPVVVHGLSFAQPHAPEGLVGKYKPPVAGALNIGLMHTSVGGSIDHDPYAPCTLGDLLGAGYRYWALGHIHKRWVEVGPSMVVMPGIPQGRDINEGGAKSVSLVAIHDDGSIDIEERNVGLAQFERVTVRTDGIDDWKALAARVTESLGRVKDAVVSDHLVARLRLTGTTPLAWRIRRDLDLIQGDAEVWASMTGNAWIEKVETDCRPPSMGADSAADPLTELGRLVDDALLSSPAFKAEALLIMRDLQGQLPPELRRNFGEDEAGVEATVNELAKEGAADVVARLQGTTRSD
jgi:DNA repair protein SbcD/Mre11